MTDPTAIGKAVSAAYLAAVPEPQPLDAECPTCRAGAGRPCHYEAAGKVHMGRQDRHIRALDRRNLAATEAEDAAYHLAVSGVPLTQAAGQLSKPQRAALLVAHGWTPTNPRSSNSWRSPDLADRAVWSLAAAMRELLKAWS